MRVDLVRGAEADRRDAERACGGAARRGEGGALNPRLSSEDGLGGVQRGLDGGAGSGGLPCWEDLARRIAESAPRGQVVVEQPNSRSGRLDLRQGRDLGKGRIRILADREPPVDVDRALVRDRGERRRARADAGDRDRARAEQGVPDRESGVEPGEGGDDRCDAVDRVGAALRLRAVRGHAVSRDLELHAAALPPAHAEVGRHGDDHHLRLDPALKDQVLPGEADAVLAVNGGGDHHRHVVGQAASSCEGDSVDRGGEPALLVRSAAAVEDPTGNHTTEGVVAPLRGVRDADGVDVSVEGEHAWTRPEPTDDVAHLVDLDVLVAELPHLPCDPFAGQPLAACRRRNGHQVAQEIDASGHRLGGHPEDMRLEIGCHDGFLLHESSSPSGGGCAFFHNLQENGTPVK